MIAVLRRELRSFYATMSTWVLTACLLLAFAGLTVFYQLLYGSTSVAYTLNGMCLCYGLALPLLVGKAALRARRAGADILLASLPLRTGELLLGRYLAALAVATLPLIAFLPIPLLLSPFGAISLSSAYVACLGLFLFLVSMTAICTFLSALPTRHPTLLGIGAAVLLFLLTLWKEPFSSIPVLRGILEGINPYLCAKKLFLGYLDLSALLWMLSVTAFFLVLTRLCLRKPRMWGNRRRALLSSAVAAGVLALLITLNALLALLPFSVRNLRVDGTDFFTLSAKTLDFLDTIEADVKIYWFVDGGELSADRDLHTYLLRYVSASPRLTLEILDPDDAEDFQQTHSAITPEDMTLVVEGPERYRQIAVEEMTYYENAQLGLTLSAAEYQYSLLAYQSGDTQNEYYTYGQYLTLYSAYTKAYFDGNAVLSRAARFVAAETIPYVGVFSADKATMPDTALLSMMEEYGYGLRGVPKLSEIPAECDLLVLIAPKTDLSESEAAGLRAYLAGGGRLLLATAPGGADHPNLRAVLAEYGLSAPTGLHIVCEDDPNYFVYGEGYAYPYYIWSHLASHAITTGFDAELLTISAHAITLRPIDGVRQTPLLYTSSKGFVVEYASEGSSGKPSEDRDKYLTAVLAEKGDSALLWIASTGTLSDFANVQSKGGNYLWLHNAMDYLMDISTETLPITGELMPTDVLRVKVGVLAAFCVIGALVPIGVLAAGGVRLRLRKKRSLS